MNTFVCALTRLGLHSSLLHVFNCVLSNTHVKDLLQCTNLCQKDCNIFLKVHLKINTATAKLRLWPSVKHQKVNGFSALKKGNMEEKYNS